MSTQPKFTPGPHRPANYNGRVFIEDANGENIAEMLGVANQQQMHADANLYAAAPDLYAAAERALAYLLAHTPKGNIRDNFSELNEHANDACKPLHAALAKARGESTQ